MKISKKQNTDFGMVLTLIFLVAGTIRPIHFLYTEAIVSLLITLLLPVVYTPFSWIWFQVSGFLEVLFSTILLSVVFYLVVTPVGFIRRVFAKDHLYIRSFKKNKKSVFVVKRTTYQKEDLENQF